MDNSAFAWVLIVQSPEDIDKLPQWILNSADIVIEGEVQEIEFGSTESKNESYTKPTFGLDHENNQKVVEDGFGINNSTFTIKDNYHTPFAEQTINIGETNLFDAKIYADKGLKVQEFLFGIPKVGEAHLAEVGVEVWFDYDGEIQKIKAVQQSNVIDEKTLQAEHEKVKCKPSSTEEKCDLVKISAIFLEPLKYKVMALKAIDFKNRYQITYLNEGISIAGDSLNPMKIEMIPSNIKNEGLIQVTQISKYSPYWISEDGRMFERNSFGSFKQVNYEFKRFHDVGDVKKRNHSEFDKILNYEKNRATKIFDAAKLTSDLPDSFKFQFVVKERMTEELKQQMMRQEEIAKKTLEENNIQARW